MDGLVGEKERFFFDAVRQVVFGQLSAQSLQFAPGLVKFDDEGGGVVRKAKMTSVST